MFGFPCLCYGDHIGMPEACPAEVINAFGIEIALEHSRCAEDRRNGTRIQFRAQDGACLLQSILNRSQLLL